MHGQKTCHLPIRYFLALLWAHPILHISTIRVNIPSSVARNRSYSSTQFLPKRPRQLRSDCGGTFWPTSAPRIGFRGVQTSKLWTISCGLFWRTWCAESVTTVWRAWGDPLWRQWKRSLWRWSVRQQQSGRSVSRLASRHRAAFLSDIIINENLELLQNKLFGSKSGCFQNLWQDLVLGWLHTGLQVLYVCCWLCTVHCIVQIPQKWNHEGLNQASLGCT